MSDSDGVKTVKSAFVVWTEEDGSIAATNSLGDVIVYVNGSPMLLEVKEDCGAQEMLRATREVTHDLEDTILVDRVTRSVVPTLMNAQMEQAKQMQEKMQNQEIASKLQLPKK